jgi:sterol desaturase/sphingolipid hydroxylase (fatty acid hydroxylase superfamily)
MVTLYLAGAFLFVASLERVPRLRFAPSPFLRPYLATDTLWYLAATGSSAVSVFVFRPVLENLALPGVAGLTADLPMAARFLLALAAYDFVAFAVHLGIHRSDTLWSVHKVHHSSLRLDWLATTRTHVFEHLVRNIPAQAVLFALGVPGAQIAVVALAYALFALLGHSNLALDLRWAEPVFVTPRLHRRHHVVATTQRNFGTVFSVWDRLFGLLVRQDTDPDEPFGVPGERETYPQRFADAFRAPARELRARRYPQGPWSSAPPSGPSLPPSPSSASSGPPAMT